MRSSAPSPGLQGLCRGLHGTVPDGLRVLGQMSSGAAGMRPMPMDQGAEHLDPHAV